MSFKDRDDAILCKGCSGGAIATATAWAMCLWIMGYVWCAVALLVSVTCLSGVYAAAVMALQDDEWTPKV